MRRTTQTLLAVQEWVAATSAEETAAAAEWRLVSHKTIPFAPGIKAGAVLRCDERGCIALINRAL